jgi:hypothetical protein
MAAHYSLHFEARAQQPRELFANIAAQVKRLTRCGIDLVTLASNACHRSRLDAWPPESQVSAGGRPVRWARSDR